MYISKYWGSYIGDTDDSLNLVAFLEDQKKEEIALNEIFAKIGLNKQKWEFRQTVEYLEFMHSSGVEIDFHYAIDVIKDLAAILLECYVNGHVNLYDLDEDHMPSRYICITATTEEHDAMNRALADFAKNPLSYDLHELVDDEDMLEMAKICEQLRKELYESTGGSHSYRVESEEAETEKDMELLKQCQVWGENGEVKKIIDALEAVPAEERTPEMDSELARAYNNQGAACSNRELFKKAIALLEPHEEYFEGDHYWNFRLGYSYYCLEQEGRALSYFRKALEVCPGDADTQELIDRCEEYISMPCFRECFRERTEAAWEAFSEQETRLRSIMDHDKNREHGEELIEQCRKILNLAFDDICFELGYNGEKYELILTPEGDKVKLFEMVYFRKHAPRKILKRWNILVGRQSMENIGLCSGGWDISGDDVQVWLENQSENSFTLSVYCEKLLPLLREEEGRAWWMLTTLTDQVLGEIPHMRYIDNFDVLETPKVEPSFVMSKLPDKLKELGLNLSADPEDYLESYTGYKMKPDEDPSSDWRLDVVAGSTCCVPILNGYLNADNDVMDDLHADGAVAGFICYPLDTLREEEGSRKIFDFRDNLEEKLTKACGPDVLTLIGGATGLYCGYVDFIAWDFSTTLNMAKEFFADTEIPWASLHTFRREAGTVQLKNPTNGE